MDDVSQLDSLTQMGEKLGQMVLDDITDPNVGQYCCNEEVTALLGVPPVPDQFRC